MNNTSLFFKLSIKFFKRYFREYFSLYAKYLLIFIASFIFIPLVNISPFFALPVLFIAIPVSCWASWKIYVIAFALIPASYDFLKNGSRRSFKEIFETIETKKLLSFVSFYFLVSILLFTPLIFVLITKFSQIIAKNYTEFLIQLIIISVVTFFVSIPFFMLNLQAFYFKSEEENYFDVFKNCYKKLNLEFVAILFVIAIFSIIINILPPLFSGIANIIAIPFFYSVLSFWYISRIQN